jgi:hypothetical protein
MRLYWHRTDRGEQYFCSECVPGTEEGSMELSQYVVRIDCGANLLIVDGVCPKPSNLEEEE